MVTNVTTIGSIRFYKNNNNYRNAITARSLPNPSHKTFFKPYFIPHQQFQNLYFKPNLIKPFNSHQFTHKNVVKCSLGPLIFASIKTPESAKVIKTPLLTAAASAIAKWLNLYSEILVVRILLAWFPNMSWEMQPFSAIRNICDPFLSLFRNIIPPICGNIDVSSLLAFLVLGILGSILGSVKVP